MLFLIEYDRPHGRLITFRRFADSERQRAQDERLELELELNRRGIKHEVVIPGAVSEEAVRRTHRRYFEDLAELAKFPVQ
jgi:hypothetical protein